MNYIIPSIFITIIVSWLISSHYNDSILKNVPDDITSFDYYPILPTLKNDSIPVSIQRTQRLPPKKQVPIFQPTLIDEPTFNDGPIMSEIKTPSKVVRAKELKEPKKEPKNRAQPSPVHHVKSKNDLILEYLLSE